MTQETLEDLDKLGNARFEYVMTIVSYLFVL